MYSKYNVFAWASPHPHELNYFFLTWIQIFFGHRTQNPYWERSSTVFRSATHQVRWSIATFSSPTDYSTSGALRSFSQGFAVPGVYGKQLCRTNNLKKVFFRLEVFQKFQRLKPGMSNVETFPLLHSPAFFDHALIQWILLELHFFCAVVNR
jgi:hypothetical protein